MKIIYLSLIIVGLLATNIAGLEVSTKKHDSYYHFLQGLVYQRSGNIIQAVREFEKTIRDDPNAVAAYRELILSYLSVGDTNNAVYLASELDKIAGDDVDVQLFLGGFYAVVKDTGSALSSYNKILEKDPNNLETILSLASIYYEIDPEKTLKYWNKYIELNPNSSDAYYNMGLAFIKLKKMDEARKTLNEAIEKDRQNIAPRIALAQIYEYEKDYLNAAEEYSKCIKIDPKNLLLLIKTGSLYYTSKQYSEAERIFKKILKLHPEDPSAYLWLSLLYEEKKEWPLAAEYMEYSLDANPSVASYIRLSYYYIQSGNYKKAIKILEKAKKLDPKSPEPCFFLGLGYMDLKKYNKAEKYFIKTVELRPDIEEAHFYLGVIYEQTDRFKKSIPQLRKVIELTPKNAVALNYLGYSFADRGMNLDEAEELIKKALKIDPENGAFIDSLGWVYFKKGRITEAEEELKRAVGKVEDSIIYEHLGDVRVKLGKNSEALKNYNKALKLDPKNSKLKDKIDVLKPK
jgi:tetratricopeptide (TPR) repeat protein